MQHEIMAERQRQQICLEKSEGARSREGRRRGGKGRREVKRSRGEGGTVSDGVRVEPFVQEESVQGEKRTTKIHGVSSKNTVEVSVH